MASACIEDTENDSTDVDEAENLSVSEEESSCSGSNQAEKSENDSIVVSEEECFSISEEDDPVDNDIPADQIETLEVPAIGETEDFQKLLREEKRRRFMGMCCTERFFSAINLQFTNLTTEMASVQPYIISADSLFLEILSQNFLNQMWGGQTLVVVYFFEKFLQSLTNIDGHYKLIWFNDLEVLYKRKVELCLMYQVVKIHSVHHLDALVVDNPRSSTWLDECLKNNLPPFVMISLNTICDDDEDDEEKEDADEWRSFQQCFGFIIFTSLISDVNVVDFSGLQRTLGSFSGFHAKGYAIPFGRYKKLELELIDEFLWYIWSRNTKNDCARQTAELRTVYNNVEEFWCNVIKLTKENAIKENLDDVDKALERFLLCIVLQQQMPLSLRTCDQASENGCQEVPFVRELITSIAELLSVSAIQFETADMYDGKLFSTIYNNCWNDVFSANDPCFLKYLALCEKLQISTKVCGLSNCSKEICEANINLASFAIESASATTLTSTTFIDNDLVKEYCRESIAVIDKETWFVKKIFTDNHFLEQYHWHSGKLFEEDFSNKKPQQPMTVNELKKLNRRLNRFRAWIHFYGDTLGEKVMNKAFATCRQSNMKVPSKDVKGNLPLKEQSMKKNQKDLPGKMKKETTKQKRLNKIEAEQYEKCRKSEKEKVKKLKDNISRSKNYDQNLQKLERLFDKLKIAETKVDVLMKQVDILVANIPQCSDVQVQQHKVVPLFQKLKMLLVNFNDVMDERQQRRVWNILHGLGFELTFPTDVVRGKVSLQYHHLSLEMDIYSYQLKYCGELLEIQTNPQPDKRVQFVPDSWQVDLLNIVDQNSSALIVAPTSAGKTFVSYYCIERVLHETTDGIVIYVSPTKALVNQVAATIYARFKSVQLKQGQSTFGIFTRDYRVDVTNCRVLVTLPQCLEILLLSPCCSKWVTRIKYAIFDEIHCIGGGIGDIKGSEVLEHIILMMQCPFLALSATVGNPSTLLHWLQRSELCKQEADEKSGSLHHGKQCYNVELVQCSERYSELQLFQYDFSEHELNHLHPFSTLQLSNIAQFGFASDMQLTAKETYRLYECMAEEDSDVISPATFFGGKNGWINRNDLRSYELHLKETFKTWLPSDVAKAERVILKVNNEYNLPSGDNKNVQHFTGLDIVADIITLVEKLNEQDMLPCLAFSNNRRLCERLARKVCLKLDRKKSEFMSITENQKKWNAYAKKLELYEKEALKKVNEKKNSAKQRKDECWENAESQLTAPIAPFNLEEKFSFCPPAKDNGLFNKVIMRLHGRDGKTRQSQKSTRRFIYLLRHGVGVHHSGLTKTQRQSVEILFRAGILRIVFSTATLALGINMPCRTVVFCDDSPYLTPLQYRQMSGRAGRRGFDKKGNVVFYGLSAKKIRKLLNSNLSNLKGNLPFSVSFVLRLLILTSKTNVGISDLKPLINKCLVCLKNPLIIQCVNNGKDLQKQLDCYFIFCLQILKQMNVIDNQGNPIGLAGMLSHLHYHEPGNFIFVYFLQKGLFHDLCSKYSGEELREKIVVILATIFTNVRLPYGWERGRKFHSSKVILKPMLEQFENAIVEYNKSVEELFLNYVTSSCDKEKNRNIAQLPLSKLEIGSDFNPEMKKVGRLFQFTESRIQNPIVAISGLKDSCISVLDNNLVSPLDESLHFDHSFLPTKSYPLYNHRGERISLNAYAVDFYRHGSRTAIYLDNNLFEGDVYHLLKDFMLTIAAINTSLDFLADPDDKVVTVFHEIGELYGQKFRLAF